MQYHLLAAIMTTAVVAGPQPFGQLPHTVTARVEAFPLLVPQQNISDFKSLLYLSKIGPSTWANDQQNGEFGVSRQWLDSTKDVWLSQFNWRARETRVNSFPNFRITINDSDFGDFGVHFAALFSSRPDAIPIIFLHGWPGSFMEFLRIMELLSHKYTPGTLPYHVVVPSLPGYGLSSQPPLNKEFTMVDAARILNQMMIELGFGNGYIAQGGDVGSFISSLLARNHAECKAFHRVNLLMASQSNHSMVGLTATDLDHLERAKRFQATGTAYAMEHGTRPATIGLALSASPLGLLAWIGEKLLEWVDEPLPLDDILADVSLYWFTSTYPSSLYPYRATFQNGSDFTAPKNKPLGFSSFPFEIYALPKAWAEEEYPNLRFYREHDKASDDGWNFHESLLADVEEFIAEVGRPAVRQ
ncbi:epoxide hydrolase [Fusarium albosuccineum]|uniref:Epoxide hydrolase n=1 Tax=Fusarium albosuccineum TaxID=1237068 RepID=A0A8H4P8L1_9HYPO|nr:epoxide hydrolase [Fusarium albosuccineum]